MAGSSFVKERYESHFVDVEYVDRILQWNPHPRPRDDPTLSSADISESDRQYRRENALEIAKNWAGRYARHLAAFPDGRAILDTENAGEYASDPKFWCARASYYQAEYDKLEEGNRQWREPTPEIYHPGLWEPELDRAKVSVQNAAQLLARCPTGKTLLESEDHGGFATDPEHWRNKEKLYTAFYEAECQKTELERAKRCADDAARDLATFPAGKTLLKVEDHGDLAADPGYWWSKAQFYVDEGMRLKKAYLDRWKRVHLEGKESTFEDFNMTALKKHNDAEDWKSELERAKRCADYAAQDLAQFPAGRVLLEAEAHGDSATDPRYWRGKQEFYMAERWKLEQGFWDRWKRIYLEGGMCPFRPPHDSDPNIEAQHPPAPEESGTLRVTRSVTQRRKETDQQPSMAGSGSPTCFAAVRRTRDGRTNGRCTNKDKPRSQNLRGMTTKLSLPLPACSVTQGHPNTYAIPKSDRPGPSRSVIKSHSQPQNPYMSRRSGNCARQRRKCNGVGPRKHRRHRDSAYHGSKGTFQPTEPISSRLRSSGSLPRKKL